MRTIGESIQVWVVRLVGLTAESWRPVLSIAEWEKAMRYRLIPDQIRSAVTRGVLRTLLGEYLGVPPTEIVFTQNKHEKPALAGGGIEFNVSHSGDYSLLAFSQHSPVGADVEHMRTHQVAAELAARVLSPAEHERFMSLPESDRTQTFFEIWTLKESVLKAIGSGLSVAPDCIEIAFHPDPPKLLSADTDLIKDVADWTLHSLDIGAAHYTAAITVKQRAPQIETNYF